MLRILVVDDDSSIAKTFQEYLKSKDDNQVETAFTAAKALSALERQEFDLTLLDLGLPDKSGHELIQIIRELQPANQIIVITGNGTVENAVKALKSGASDFLTKPIENFEILNHVITKVLSHRNLATRLEKVERELNEKYGFEKIIGHSQVMQQVFSSIRDVAYSDATIMIQGESGTGKELIARAIHHNSSRKNQDLIAFNCSALTESLVESELFGHVKGAFTHAINDKRGLFEVADHGTLFLDEIGDLSPHIQSKLLRVLQEGEIMRVGSTEVRKVDVRIIAATHFNLEEMVQKGKFRPDLFYRLNVINVELPNLRARKEDIEVLTLHFIEKFNQKTNKKIKGIEPAAMEAMKTYNWPGNVRELENAIERATVIEKTEWITLNSLPVTLQRAKSFIDHPFNVPESAASVITQSYKEAKKQALAGFNHHYLSKLMKQTSGNISKAALLAGMERSNFKKLLNLADLDPRKYKKKLSDSMDVDDATFEATSKVN